MLNLGFYRTIAVTQRLLPSIPLFTQWERTLFSEKILRISEYESHRMRLLNYQFDPKKLMFELRSNNLDGVIRCTKQWIHKMDRHQCETEFLLLQSSLRHIYKNADNKTMYNFGPTVMRMLHFFNLPEKALQINYDLQLVEMFQQLSCVIIVCDMLFNNGMYKEMVQMIQRKRDDQLKKGMSTSRHINYLLFAGCYKLNTPEYYKYALEVWNNCVKEHQLSQTINFMSMLAINQGQPQTALEILSLKCKHFSSINIRLIALIECGRFDEAEHIVQDILTNEQYKNYKLSLEVVERIKEKLSSENQPSIDNIFDEFQQQKRLTNVTIDEMLCWPISDRLQNQDSKNDRRKKEQSG